MSKPSGGNRTKVAVILIVTVVVVVAGVWLWSSNYFKGGGATATSDKIEIVDAITLQSGSPYTINTAVVSVRNTGSAPVEIASIYIGSDRYDYSASVAPGKFSAPSNQIAPGETMTFTITRASGYWSPMEQPIVKAATKNGAEATRVIDIG